MIQTAAVDQYAAATYVEFVGFLDGSHVCQQLGQSLSTLDAERNEGAVVAPTRRA